MENMVLVRIRNIQTGKAMARLATSRNCTAATNGSSSRLSRSARKIFTNPTLKRSCRMKSGNGGKVDYD